MFPTVGVFCPRFSSPSHEVLRGTRCSQSPFLHEVRRGPDLVLQGSTLTHSTLPVGVGVDGCVHGACTAVALCLLTREL